MALHLVLNRCYTKIPVEPGLQLAAAPDNPFCQGHNFKAREIIALKLPVVLAVGLSSVKVKGNTYMYQDPAAGHQWFDLVSGPTTL